MLHCFQQMPLARGASKVTVKMKTRNETSALMSQERKIARDRGEAIMQRGSHHAHQMTSEKKKC